MNRYLHCLLEPRIVANHCRAGAGYFTLSPDKTVHPCHRLVGDEAWNLGLFGWNPADPACSTREKLRPWHTPVDQRPVCRECPIRYLCGGGCKQQALLASGNLLGNDPSICAFAVLLFEAAATVGSALPDPLLQQRLRSSFAELETLFVLCGQRTLPVPQPHMRNPTLTIGGKEFPMERITL